MVAELADVDQAVFVGDGGSGRAEAWCADDTARILREAGTLGRSGRRAKARPRPRDAPWFPRAKERPGDARWRRPVPGAWDDVSASASAAMTACSICSRSILHPCLHLAAPGRGGLLFATILLHRLSHQGEGAYRLHCPRRWLVQYTRLRTKSFSRRSLCQRDSRRCLFR